MATIKVSQLDEQFTIYPVDFFPLVKSSSLITYRANLQTLENFLGIPEISMSWATHSISSSYALSASYPSYPQISCSWSTQSISSSYVITTSYAPFGGYIPQFSCSWVSQSISSSYALTASWAPQATFTPQISCSLAMSESVSSSYALSASWAPSHVNANNLIPVYLNSSINILTSTTESLLFQYTVNQSQIPYTHGIIIQGVSTVVSSNGGEDGIFYISSSLVSPPIPLSSVTHGNVVNTIFLPMSSNNSNIIISASNMITTVPLGRGGEFEIDTWSVNILGYY